MNIGFYYHVEAVFREDEVTQVPAYFGRFLIGLAKEAGEVTCFLHEGRGTGTEDLALPSSVHVVKLPPKTNSPSRTFRPGQYLRIFRQHAAELDVLLLRGPSPLLPALGRSFQGPVALLIVGDALSGIAHLPQPPWRKALIYGWTAYNTLEQRLLARKALVLVNSSRLYQDWAGAGKAVSEVFTSAVSEADIAGAVERPLHSPIRLLYAGRFDRTKGLLELVKAVRLLRDRGVATQAMFAGWGDAGDPTEHDLRELAVAQGVRDRVLLAGYLQNGPELAAWLREGDLFVLPSYAEGFPRSVLDAMAAGLPVIATKVGGIPARLKDGETARLIEPRSAAAIADSVEELSANAALRSTLARNGLGMVGKFTNEKSCALIVDRLRAWATGGKVLVGPKT